jgi:hypothetical protein
MKDDEVEVKSEDDHAEGIGRRWWSSDGEVAPDAEE